MGALTFAERMMLLTASALAIERLAARWCRTRGFRRLAAVALAAIAGVLLLSDLRDVLTLARQPPYSVAGIIPLSDADAYVKGALQLLETGRLDEFNSRRPIPVTLLAVLFKLTGHSFGATLWLQALMEWACVSVALREVALRLGLTAGAVMLAIVAGHHTLYTGTFMTEPLGFMFDALGFALMLRGFWDGDRRAVLAGIVLFGLGLAARAGPTPALLLLAVYGGWHFRGDRRLSWRMLGACLVAAMVPTLLAELQLSVLGSPRHMMQSNLSFTLYGLAVGGKGWHQVMIDHPELPVTSDVDRARMIYGLFWDELKRHPEVFFQALGKSWWQALGSPFKTLFDIGLPVPRELFFLPAVLGAVALGQGFLRRGRDAMGFVVVVLAATFACYPLLADAWPRVLASTICFHGAVAALGASLIAGTATRPLGRVDPVGTARSAWLAIGSLSFAAAVCLSPLPLAVSHPDISHVAPPSCAPDEVPLVVRLTRGAEVSLDAASRQQILKTRMPGLSDAKFLPDGARFTSTIDLLMPDSSPVFVLFTDPSQADAIDGKITPICGRAVGGARTGFLTYAGRIPQ